MRAAVRTARKDPLADNDTARLLPASPMEMTPGASSENSTPLAPHALPPNAWAFATLIQARFRGARIRHQLHRWLGRAVGVPDMERAKAHARSLLPHDQEGRMLPLSCPIECFTVFGAGVYAYMLWAVLMKRVFFVAFLFSVANMVNNIFGGELSQGSWLSVPTIGNAKELNAAYGASEVLVLGTFVWGMFAAVRIVRKEEALLQPLHTPGEQTVMLTGLPLHAPAGGGGAAGGPSASLSHDALVESMGLYGDVSHAVIAAPIRPTLLRMPERARLLQQLLTARIELFLRGKSHPQSKRFPAKSARGVDTPATVRTMARAEAAATAATAAAATGRHAPTALNGHEQRRSALVARVETATRTLQAHDDESARMLRAARGGGLGGADAQPMAHVPTPCGTLTVRERGRQGGVAFVTFTEPAAAERAISGINDAQATGILQHELAPLFVPTTSGDDEAMADGRAAGGGGAAGGGAAGRGARARVAPGGADATAGGGKIHARRAPEPSDVTWENLHVGPMERLWRQFFSTLAMLGIACVGTMIITAVMYLNSTGVYASLVNLPGGFEGWLLSSAMQVTAPPAAFAAPISRLFSSRHLLTPSPHAFARPHTHLCSSRPRCSSAWRSPSSSAT